MTIEFYKVKQLGRIDCYPVDEKVGTAIKCMAGKNSPVMTPGMIRGLELLGILFIEVLPPYKKQDQERTA